MHLLLTKKQEGVTIPASKAQQKAVSKYMKENYDEIKVRVGKGCKAKIKLHAETFGESVNGFINRAIKETMKHDNISSCQKENALISDSEK